MKVTSNKIAFAILVAVSAWYACPTQASKNAGGLRLNRPVECPDSVQFSWTGGQLGTTYSLYRRKLGDTYWERIAMNLTGISGSVIVDGFTLDQTYDYEIRADMP